jgi:hypothetical protein
MPKRIDSTDPRRPRQTFPPTVSSRHTVRLAILFTLFMLGIAAVLWKFSTPAEKPAVPAMWIRTESATGEAGQPVALRAFVGDEKDRPIHNFGLVFTHAALGKLGEAATADDGYATITCKFERAGDYVVDVRAQPGEKRDFAVVQNGSIRVTIVKPASTE